MTKSKENELVALVRMRDSSKHGFKFVDCVAEWITDDDPPEGYGQKPERDKYGNWQPSSVSYVAGLVGASMVCVIYPAQFKIPGDAGERVDFHASPRDILDACVQRLAEERCPPEYVI